MDTSNNEENSENTYEAENFVPVEAYEGEGFTLRDADAETGEIAEEHRAEVIAAVEDYFQTNYHTEVNVHNIVSAVDAVSVFVESVGAPHFYSFAIVPVDVENNEVQTGQVRTKEGQVENGIEGGLYQMAFSEQFESLDRLLEKLTEEHPVTGTPQAVIEGVKGNGFTTPYYFISAFDDVLTEAFDQYMENPQITPEALRTFFNEQSIDPEGITIAIELYMEDEKEDPSEEVFDEVYKKLQEQDLPGGEYYLFLNDGLIDKKRAIGKKENTIEKTFQVEFNK